jgi:hypothetical protein
MSAKRLLPLTVLLVVLVIAVVLVKRPSPPPRLAEETGFERLLPATLRAESIRGVDLYQGAKPAEAVRLRLQDGVWVVTSYYDAPGQSDKISKFLQALSGLEGELRADQPDLLGDFRLAEAQALHLRLYTDNLETPAFHLLAGKGSGRNGFVRLADKKRVYSVNLNIPSEAGVTPGETEQPPPAKPWLHLNLAVLPAEPVTALEIQTPTRMLHFVQAPAASPPAATSETPPTTSPGTPSEAPVKPSWSLTAPQVAFTVKPGGVDGMLSTLRSLRADDIADPANLADYGLEHAPYRLLLTGQAANQEARQTTLLVGNTLPEQQEKRYARLGMQGPVYVLPGWAFARLFPAAKELLELPRLAENAADIQRVAWQRGAESWTLEKQAGASSASETEDAAWKLLEAPEAVVDTPAVQSLLEAITRLTIEDWVEHPATPTGLESPQLGLQVTFQDGRTAGLTVGGEASQPVAGQYARLLEGPETLLVPATAYKTLTEALHALQPAASVAVPSPSSSSR